LEEEENLEKEEESILAEFTLIADIAPPLTVAVQEVKVHRVTVNRMLVPVATIPPPFPVVVHDVNESEVNAKEDVTCWHP
jgi:hypothetical protein